MSDVKKAWLPAFSRATVGVRTTVGIVGGAVELLLGLPIFQALLLGAVIGSTDHRRGGHLHAVVATG